MGGIEFSPIFYYIFIKGIMVKISTCLIVKNESSCIERCLDGITSFSDEIIIYDTGSEDGTQDLCRRYGNVKIIQGFWDDDFSIARNESFKYASNDYIMWIDADDVIDEQSQKWLCEFKKTELQKYNCVYFEYIYDMSENGDYTTHFYRERIVNKKTNPIWVSPIHEYISYENNGGMNYYASMDEFKILHYKHSPNPLRNINIYKRLESENKITTGRDWFYYAQECRWHDSTDSAIEKYLKCLNFDDIWYVDKLNAYYQLSMLYKNEKGDIDSAKKFAYLAASLTNIPRADVCCLLGDIYLELGIYNMSSIWFKLAIGNKPSGFDGTFMLECYYQDYPMLQACVSLYREGKVEESEKYNEMYLKIKPNDEIGLSNKAFFNSLKK